jgi:hypothetical protein
MKNKSRRIIKACMAALLVALGFASCTKPDDDPVHEPNGIPGVYAYGTLPATYQEVLPND